MGPGAGAEIKFLIVRVANRLIYFLKRFGAFIILQLADYYTYGLADLLLFLVRYRHEVSLHGDW